MFKKKQSAPKKRDDGTQQRKRSPMPSGMFGFYDMGDDMMGDGSDDDPNLEAELNQILGGGKKKGAPQKPKKQLMDWSELDAQISSSLRDDIDDDGEEMDLDDLDGELEAELEDIVSDEEDTSLAPPAPTKRRSPSPQPQAASSGPVQLLEDRKKNYENAIHNAQEKGEGSKARRYKRGLDTINVMLKKAKAGKPINEEEIPCQVATGKPPAAPAASEGTPSAAATTVRASLPEPQPVTMHVEQPKPKINLPKPEIKIDSTVVDELTKRQQQFKIAAITAKRSGDKEEALKLFKCIKLYDAALTEAKEGRPVDMAQMPRPPTKQATPAAPAATTPPAQPKNEPVSQAPEPPQTSKGVPTPKTMLEGLTQRRQKYQSTADQAKAEGNGSKSRRMMRIVKQYDDAIKMCKLGKPFDVAELPVPMGYPPLPGINEKQQDISDVLQQAANIDVERDNTNIPPPQVAMAAHAAAAANPVPRPKLSPNTLGKPKQPARSPSPASPEHSAYQQQLDFLLNRKAAFKEAALVAKRKGDKETAMDLLKKMKGFEPMIEQARNGLKIDITKVPMPPMIRDEDPSVPNDVTFEILDGGKHHEDDTEIYKTLLEKLHEQVKKARGYSDQFTHSGDVSGANMFDQLAQESQTDYDFVKNLKRHGDPPPRYFYDTKTFQSVHIIPELNTTDLELIIVQLLDLDAKDAKPSIEWEMPFPNDSPIKGKTEEAKGMGNYKFDAQFRVPINRKNRSFQRAIKSKGIKLEVIQKGGFLRSDKSLGSALVKLAPLETSCEIHAVEPLKEGRAVVGRVEVKVRMRTPLVSSESKTMTEKWLLVRHEHVQRRAAPTPSSRNPPQAPKPRGELAGSQRKDYKHPKIQGSIEVLALEKRAVEAKIKSFQSKGERPPVSVLQNQQSVHSKLSITSKFVREGGTEAMRYYVQYLKTEIGNLTKEAQNFVKIGRNDQAKICLTKRKMIENEVHKIAPSKTYM